MQIPGFFVFSPDLGENRWRRRFNLPAFKRGVGGLVLRFPSSQPAPLFLKRRDGQRNAARGLLPARARITEPPGNVCSRCPVTREFTQMSGMKESHKFFSGGFRLFRGRQIPELVRARLASA